MSNKKNDAEQKPLMYIVQPDYDAAEANMQDILIKRKKRQKKKHLKIRKNEAKNMQKNRFQRRKRRLKQFKTGRRTDLQKE